VVGFADFAWPPPSDWQKFERLCHALWQRIWRDPNAQMHGRAGQAQQGVDVYGTPQGETQLHGIQCKRRDPLLHRVLTEEEVLIEVENAKAFQPPLAELIIATCAPSDVKLQALARQITEEHAAHGLFRVHVFGWSEILVRIGQYPEVIAEIYPVRPTAEGSRELPRSEPLHAELLTSQRTLQQQLERLSAQLDLPADGPAHAKLDLCRNLLHGHDYRAAVGQLERLRQEEWETASASVRFRIATNLGAAYVGLGEYAKAGEWYVQAFAFDSSSDKALANRALGLLLLDRPDEALAAAREALDRHPTSPLSWKAYLNVFNRIEPQAPLPEVPADLALDPDMLFLRADTLALQGRWGDAEEVLRQLIALPTFDRMAKARLADVILTQVTGGRFYGGVPYSASEFARLNEAGTLLEEVWNALKRTEDATAALPALLNWCALRAVLGQMAEAESVIDEALALTPDVPALLVWKIRMATARGDGTVAARVLEKLSPDQVPEYPIIAAGAYRAAKELGRAAALLEQYLTTPDPEAARDPEVAYEARCMLADLLCESDLLHAEARFDALPEAGTPHVARATVIFARALREAGAAAAAERYLALARDVLAVSSQARDRLMLADGLSEFEQYEAALVIYEQDVATSIDTPSLREYVRCLLELDQRRRLVDVLAALPEEVSRKTYYEWVRANLGVRGGDYRAAREAAERYLILKPVDFSAQMLRAEVCARLGDAQPARDWLGTIDIRSSELTLDQLLRIRRIYHILGRPEEAAATCYEALRRFPHDPSSHLAFCSSVLFTGEPAWLPKRCSVAARDTAVRLRDADGHEHAYILEDRPPSELLQGEVALTSEFGQRLLGHKVDDTVTGHTSHLAVHESTIVAIDHKYVYALQASMTAFNTRFPDNPGLVGVKMPVSATPEEQAAPVLRALKEKAALVKQVEALLPQGLPIAALAARMGRASPEIWLGLRGRAAQPIPVCMGTAEERVAVENLTKLEPRRFLLEPIALLELHQLKALQAAEAVCGRFGLVEATLEELRGQLTELDLHRDGYMTMFEQDGGYHRLVITAHAVAAERQQLQSLLNWAHTHCDVLAAVPAVDPRPETATRLDRGLGSAVYDSLIAAQGHHYVLVSDDFNLRRLGTSEFGIAGIWIQPLLIRALAAGHLKGDHYNRAVSSLAVWRHDFTSINAEQLLFAANRGGWKVTPEFEALVATLPLNRSDLRVHFAVCLSFLKELWRAKRGPTRSQATKLTQALLKGVDPGASPNCQMYIRELYRATTSRWLPESAWQAIVQWYRNQNLPATWLP
jgi:tetratricopeptide (TPR) repeat protein